MKHLFTTFLLALCLGPPAATWAQSLVAITPDSSYSEYYSGPSQHTIYATGTNFTNGSVLWVSLNQHAWYMPKTAPSEMHTGVTWQVLSPTSIAVTLGQNYYCCYSFYNGAYDVEVMTTTGLLKLDSAFRIKSYYSYNEPPYLNGGDINVFPNTGTPGQTLDVVVTGRNARFNQASSVLHFDFDQGLKTKVVNSLQRINDSVLLANITIPPATPLGKYDLKVFTSFNGAPHKQNAFRVVSSLPAPGAGSIQGQVFLDNNKNCLKEGGEGVLSRRVVRAEPGPHFAVTSGNGAYNLRVPYGTYTVQSLRDAYHEPTCNPNGLTNQTVSAGAPTLTGRNFADTAIVCNTTVRVARIEQIPPQFPYNNCPQFDVTVVHKGRVFGYRYLKLQLYDANHRRYYDYYGGSNQTTLSDTALQFNYMQPGEYRVIAESGICADTAAFVVPNPNSISCEPYVKVLSTTLANGCAQGSVTFEYRGAVAECASAYAGLYIKNGLYYYPALYFYADYNLAVEQRTRTLPLGEYLLVSYCPTGSTDTARFNITGTPHPLVITAANASTASQYRIEVAVNNACESWYSFGGTATNIATGANYQFDGAGAQTKIINVMEPGRYKVVVERYPEGSVSQFVDIGFYTWPLTFGAANDDYVKGLVRDADGNTYVSLSFRGTINLAGTTLTSTSSTRRDMAIAKFHSNGYLLWVRKMGNGTFDMEPQGVNIDGAGNPYWAGSFAGSINFSNGNPGGIGLTAAGSYDAFTARFDPESGHCLWAKRAGGAGNDYLYGCFVSNSGNVYAGGSYTGAINFATISGNVALPNAGGLDGFIVKFDPNGNGMWASRMGSADNDEVKSIDYNGGDLVATGYMGNNCSFGATNLTTLNGSRDGWSARINSNGGFVWVKGFGTIFNDEATSICMDPSTGNVFVAAQVADAPVSFNGTSYPGKGGNDIMVLGWNFYTQAPVWARRAGSTTGDSPSQIRWDGLRLVVAGYGGLPFSTDNTAICCSSGQDGVLMHFNKLNGTVTNGPLFIGGNGNDRAFALWCNTTTREAVVGGAFSNTAAFPGDLNNPFRTSNGGFDGFVAIYPAASGAREAAEPAVQFGTEALKAYPVPFTNQLTIETEESVELLDLQGRRMAAAASQNGQAVLKVSSLKAGIYLVRSADGKVARVVKE